MALGTGLTTSSLTTQRNSTQVFTSAVPAPTSLTIHQTQHTYRAHRLL